MSRYNKSQDERDGPIASAKILKAMVIISGPEMHGTQMVDTITHDGKTWLVPEWLDLLGQGMSMPARLILLDTLPHQKSSGAGWDFVVNYAIPKAVFDGQVPPELKAQFVVLERPNIRVPRTH